jgi:hypothetical protein
MGKTINFSVSLDFSRIDRIVESVFGVVSSEGWAVWVPKYECERYTLMGSTLYKGLKG